MSRYREFCKTFDMAESQLISEAVGHDDTNYCDLLHRVDTVPREQMQQALFELGHALYMAVNDHMEGYDLDGDYTLPESAREIVDNAFSDDASERARDLVRDAR